ncbi:MAG TPA: heavy metal translocating P-type ATPase [Tepidisphaeraceae bacterium]|jgi:Cu+-exporting ATPase|nr:heavy metal translocating P-type ATPase [Tepidisphaeraceae bacterium]
MDVLHDHDHQTSALEPREVTLNVEGMTCASCVAHVEKAVKSVAGVKDARVNLARGRATVRFDPAKTDPTKLAEAVEHSGYHAHPEDLSISAANAEEQRLHHQHAHARSWQRRWIIGLILWLPVEVLHWVVGQHAHWTIWLALATSTIAIVYLGAAFYKSAFSALRHRTSNMDTLIAMGATVAYVYSLIAFGGYLLGWWRTLPNLYFNESAGLLTLISLGHWLEAHARDRAGSAIRELLNLAPAVALRLDDLNQPREVPVAEVQKGDRVMVRPGDRVPVDGLVLEGESELDESMLSGEPLPVHKGQGDEVIAGTANQNGRLVVRATKVGAETALAQIVQLVERAQSSKPPVQQLADKVSAVFVPAVLGVALLTGTAWFVWGQIHHWPAGQTWAAIAKTVCSVLIIACPCALGLAVPATLMVGIGRGARRGILIRDIDALQNAERIDTVVLDKTGTITQGKPAVMAVLRFNSLSEDEVLRLAAAAEQFSEHPLARSIVEHARRKKLDLPDLSGFSNESGLGVIAQVNGQSIIVGNEAMLKKHGYTEPASAPPAAPDPAQTLVEVARKVDGRLERLGMVVLADPLKPDSKAAIDALHRMNLRTILLSGDNRYTAKYIADKVGIDDVRAEVRPDAKAQVIRELQSTGIKVAMVGDGINDAPALASADLGIAIGSGSDIVKETGDIVLVSGSLMGIATSIRLSRATMKKIRQNLFLAFIYNVLAIPLAAMGVLNPLIAAAAMALSDVTVLGNALLLRRTRIEEEKIDSLSH